MSYGQVIREVRHRQGLSIEQLSEKAKVSRNTIWNYESGVKAKTIQNLEQICAVLRIQIRDLFPTTSLDTMISELHG